MSQNSNMKYSPEQIVKNEEFQSVIDFFKNPTTPLNEYYWLFLYSYLRIWRVISYLETLCIQKFGNNGTNELQQRVLIYVNRHACHVFRHLVKHTEFIEC